MNANKLLVDMYIVQYNTMVGKRIFFFENVQILNFVKKKDQYSRTPSRGSRNPQYP